MLLLPFLMLAMNKCYFLFAGAAAGFGPFLLSGTPKTRDILLNTWGFGMALPDSYSWIM